jgi:hypothetical protein
LNQSGSEAASALVSIPVVGTSTSGAVAESVVDLLKSMRGVRNDNENEVEPRKKKRRLASIPGCSISFEDLVESKKEKTAASICTGTSTGTSKCTTKRHLKKNKSRQDDVEVSDCEDSDVEPEQEPVDATEDISHDSRDSTSSASSNDADDSEMDNGELSTHQAMQPKPNTYYVVSFNTSGDCAGTSNSNSVKYYVGKLLETETDASVNEFNFKFMRYSKRVANQFV